MKVILLSRVSSLGERWETIEVADGYARNYLIPKGLAIPATEANLRKIEEERKRVERKAGREKGKAEELAKKLSGMKLSLVKKAGEEGTLFGSITSMEIAEALKEKGIELDRRKIVIDEPIKKVGTYQVRVKLHTEVEEKIENEVVPQGVEEKEG